MCADDVAVVVVEVAGGAGEVVVHAVALVDGTRLVLHTVERAVHRHRLRVEQPVAKHTDSEKQQHSEFKWTFAKLTNKYNIFNDALNTVCLMVISHWEYITRNSPMVH